MSRVSNQSEKELDLTDGETSFVRHRELITSKRPVVVRKRKEPELEHTLAVRSQLRHQRKMQKKQ